MEDLSNFFEKFKQLQVSDFCLIFVLASMQSSGLLNIGRRSILKR